MVLTSALASQIKRDGTSYDFLGVVDHADYESDIFLVLVDRCGSCRSQPELSEYTKITPHCSEKIATFMGSKIVFFLHQKGTYVNPK